MKLTNFSLSLALALSLPFGLTAVQAQDVENTPRGIQTIRIVQGQELPPQEPLQVQGKSVIVVDKDGKKTEIPIDGNGSITITRSAQETNNDGKVERKVMGKAIIVGPDGKKHEIVLDGGDFDFQLGNAAGAVPLPGFVPANTQISKYFIGVHCEPVDDATREELRLAEKAGLQVIEVTPDSPAQKAGLQAGDVLLYANDTELGSREQLIDAVQKAGEAKDELAFSIVRDGKEEKVVVRPGERPEMPAIPNMPGMPAMPPMIGGMDIEVDGEGMAPDMEALKKQMEQLRVQILQNGPEGVVQGFAVPMPGIIRGMPEGFDPEQMEQLKAEMESARKQLEQAREEMEKAQTELREELQRTQREIREQMDEARKQLEKAIQELRKSKEDK